MHNVVVNPTGGVYARLPSRPGATNEDPSVDSYNGGNSNPLILMLLLQRIEELFTRLLQPFQDLQPQAQGGSPSGGQQGQQGSASTPPAAPAAPSPPTASSGNINPYRRREAMIELARLEQKAQKPDNMPMGPEVDAEFYRTHSPEENNEHKRMMDRVREEAADAQRELSRRGESLRWQMREPLSPEEERERQRLLSIAHKLDNMPMGPEVDAEFNRTHSPEENNEHKRMMDRAREEAADALRELSRRGWETS